MGSVVIVPIMFIFLFAAVSCQRQNDLAGKYRASSSASGTAPSLLVLKNDGKSTWKVEGEEVPFTWDQRGEELWLHSKSGGVIVGKIKPDSIEISLPGAGHLEFIRFER